MKRLLLSVLAITLISSAAMAATPHPVADLGLGGLLDDILGAVNNLLGGLLGGTGLGGL